MKPRSWKRKMRNKINVVLLILAMICCLPFNVSAVEIVELAQEEVQKGWEFFAENDLDGALGRFDQAIIIDPNHAPAFYGKAHVYSAKNMAREAIRFYRKTIEVADPPMVEAYVNLGFTLTLAGNEEEGYEMYKKALEIDPKNKDVHINIGHYFCGQLNGKQAWAHINFALSQGAKISKDQLNDMKSICPEDR